LVEHFDIVCKSLTAGAVETVQVYHRMPLLVKLTDQPTQENGSLRNAEDFIKTYVLDSVTLAVRTYPYSIAFNPESLTALYLGRLVGTF
jgi:hypothetical protein